jgi:hypothetical protein
VAIIVFNKHANNDLTGCDEVVNVMRPYILQNKHPITRTSLRVDVIAAFRRDLFLAMKDEASPVREELLRLVKRHREGDCIGLLCCCDPLPCHAHVIKKAIEYYAGN